MLFSFSCAWNEVMKMDPDVRKQIMQRSTHLFLPRVVSQNTRARSGRVVGVVNDRQYGFEGWTKAVSNLRRTAYCLGQAVGGRVA
jgi:hypothetical protein